MSRSTHAFRTIRPSGFGRCRNLAAMMSLLCFVVFPALAVTYSDNGDGTVTDPGTGLTWMRCAMGQTWDGSTCTGASSGYNWDQAVALTGQVNFAGHGDWRLPNIRELGTLVNRSAYGPATDGSAFPGPCCSAYWSASANADHTGNAWYLGLTWGDVVFTLKDEALSVRLVRAGQSLGLLDIARPTSDYVDHGDGTVTHTPTGLMWKRCAEGQIWDGSSCSGSPSSYDWFAANLLQSTFAGNADWRLPTVYELLTLVDYTRSGPAMNSTVFPGMSAPAFWSASRYVDPHYALVVGFDDGAMSYPGVSATFPARLVRAGSPPLERFSLSVVRAGTGTVSSTLTGISCGATCTGEFTAGTRVILKAAPAAHFISWGGACSGTTATCSLAIDAAKTAIALFRDAPVVSGLPAALDFAAQNLGSTSDAKSVTLSNSGDAPLAISSIAAGGDYAVTHNCGASLKASGVCTLNISFSPTALDYRAGSITITDDAADSPQIISLTGYGRGGVATLSPPSLHLSSPGVGTPSTARTITFTNTGGAVLNISSIAADGDFALTTTCGASLAQGVACSISVTFTPTALGIRFGNVTVTHDGHPSPTTVMLTGADMPFPVVGLIGVRLVFDAYVGTASAARTTPLYNLGTEPLEISSITASGDYATTHNCGAVLEADASCSISVSFAPMTTGTRNGSVTIVSNAAGSPHFVELWGQGLDPASATTTSTSTTTTIAGSTTTTMAGAWLSLASGWNLVGTGAGGTLNAAAFGDPAKITSLWKWVRDTSRWAFYAPALDAQGGTVLADYAASKGYDILSTIDPGEGFWVNAIQASSTAWMTGGAIDAASFQEGKPGALKDGWNLISIGNSRTPKEFNADIGANPPADGLIPLNINTLWGWDNAQGKWYFYAPSLAANGTLSSYITSKGYLDFGSRALDPAAGFWVNMPSPSITTTTVSSTTTTTVNWSPTVVGTATGNLTFTAAYSPAHPRAGEAVTFSFLKDDPDASIEYVCGNWSYGDSGFHDHIPCVARGALCDPTASYQPMHGQREWTTTTTYSSPGTYEAYFSTRSGDFYGCNPYGDDAELRVKIVVSP